jgi:hypothetical protein
VALVACSGQGGPPSASAASPEVPDPGNPDALDCPDIDLRTPGGERINLNGTWVTLEGGHRGGIYYFRQVGSCLWFVGTFPFPTGEEVGDVGALGVVTTAFLGRIDTDFEIHGTWIDVPHVNVPPAQGGTLDLRIEFDDSGAPQVAYLDDVGERFLDPTLVVDELTWVQVDDRWPYPPTVMSP